MIPAILGCFSMDLCSDPMKMSPLMPEDPGLEEKAVELVRKSSRLGESLHPVTKKQVRDLVRPLNSHYSNRIEGHDTHLKDIQDALKKDYSSNPTEKEKQKLAIAHISVQKRMEERIESGDVESITASSFIKWLHQAFYEEVPQSLRWVEGENKKKEVIPGRIRQHEDEIVGTRDHLGVAPASVGGFLDRFHEVYNLRSMGTVEKLMAFGASHYRLLWIHPFLDGNGRVARMFSHAYAMESDVDSDGLWSLSRGLARYIHDYRDALAWADKPPRNDTDGRGPLSKRGLDRFCHFLLDVAIDQVDFMDEILDIEHLEKRVRGFVRKASDGLVPEFDEPVHEASGDLLAELLYHGEINRGGVSGVIGLGTRRSRDVVSQLEDYGLVESETERGPLHIAFPEVAVRDYFPDLYSRDTGSLEKSNREEHPDTPDFEP